MQTQNLEAGDIPFHHFELGHLVHPKGMIAQKRDFLCLVTFCAFRDWHGWQAAHKRISTEETFVKSFPHIA